MRRLSEAGRPRSAQLVVGNAVAEVQGEESSVPHAAENEIQPVAPRVAEQRLPGTRPRERADSAQEFAHESRDLLVVELAEPYGVGEQMTILQSRPVR